MRWKEVHIKDHDFGVHDCVIKLNRKKQEITFSFKRVRKGLDAEVSGNALIDALMKQTFDPYNVRVRGLSIAFAEWDRVEESEAQP